MDNLADDERPQSEDAETLGAPEVVEMDNPRTIQVVETHSIRQGPLPGPSDLREYEEAWPGAAKLILEDMAQRRADRAADRTMALRISARQALIGPICFVLVVLILMLAAVAIAALGYPWVASAIAGINLVGIAATLARREHPSREISPEQEATSEEIQNNNAK